MDILLELSEAGENLTDDDIKYQLATILITVRIINIYAARIIGIYVIHKIHFNILGLWIHFDHGQFLPFTVGHPPRHSS